MLFNNITNDAYLAFIKGAEHFTFSDLEFLNPSPGSNIINPLRGIEITRTLVLSFFDVYLKKTVSPQLIINTIKRYTEISLKAKIGNKIEIVAAAPTPAKTKMESSRSSSAGATLAKQKDEKEAGNPLHDAINKPMDFEPLFEIFVAEVWKLIQQLTPDDMPLWDKHLQEIANAKEILRTKQPSSPEYKMAESRLHKISAELKEAVNEWLDKNKLFRLIDKLRLRESKKEMKKGNG